MNGSQSGEMIHEGNKSNFWRSSELGLQIDRMGDRLRYRAIQSCSAAPYSFVQVILIKTSDTRCGKACLLATMSINLSIIIEESLPLHKRLVRCDPR